MCFLAGVRRASCRSTQIVHELRRPRRGVTLIEMMVSLVITLIMMAAVIGAFSIASGTINDGRSMMEIGGRVRSAQQRLKLDLDGVTCRTLPWIRPEAGEGYIAYYEGPFTDFSPDPSVVSAVKTAGQVDASGAALSSMYGDTDDYIMFTSRSTGEPFTDASGNQSQVAEIAWACAKDPNSPASNPTFILYRKVQLVLPNAAGAGTLGDLTDPANRMQTSDIVNVKNIVLTNVVGFDIKIWDPDAPTYVKSATPTQSAIVLVPGDPGYYGGGGATGQLSGAYVDLGNKPTSAPNSRFTVAPKSGFSTPVWMTWPMSKEYAQIASNAGVDNPNNRATSPPYPYPMRGIQIKIRVYEPDSRQVQEVTVVEHFLPD